MRKTKVGDEKPSKKSGVLGGLGKKPGSAKTVAVKKEEASDEAKTKKPTSLKKVTKEAPKGTTKSNLEGSAKKISVKTAAERTSPTSKSSKTSSTSPVTSKKSLKSKSKVTEGASPVSKPVAGRTQSDTVNRRSPTLGLSVKEGSKSTTAIRGKGLSEGVSPKIKRTQTSPGAKGTALSRDAPKKTKTGVVTKTLTKLKNAITPREQKERKKSSGGSSFRLLKSKEEKMSGKLRKGQGTESPAKQQQRSSTSDLGTPTSEPTSARSWTRKKKSMSQTVSLDAELPVEPVPLATDEVVVESPPDSQPQSPEHPKVTSEESTPLHVAAQDTADSEEEEELALEPEPVIEEEEIDSPEEFVSLSPTSPQAEKMPIEEERANEQPTTMSAEPRSLTPHDAGAVITTNDAEESLDVTQKETVPESEGALVEEQPVAAKIKEESPSPQADVPLRAAKDPDECSVEAEAGSDDAKKESAHPKAEEAEQERKASLEGSVEVEVGSDDYKAESSLPTEEVSTTELKAESSPPEKARMTEILTEEKVAVVEPVAVVHSLKVEETPMANIAHEQALMKPETSESIMTSTQEESTKSPTREIKEGKIVEEETAERQEATDLPTNETPDTNEMLELTSSSLSQQVYDEVAHEAEVDASSVAVYHSEEDSDRIEVETGPRERLAELADFGVIGSDEPHEEKTEEETEEEDEEPEQGSGYRSDGFQSSDWSSDQAFLAEQMNVDDLEMTPDPSHSDEELEVPKSKITEHKEAPAPTKEKAPETNIQTKQLDFDDDILPESPQLQDPIDDELHGELMQQPRSISPPPPEDPKHEKPSKGRKGGFMSATFFVLGGLGGLAVTLFLLHKRAG